jgi:NAD(P)H-hydrate epimerase
MQPVLTVADLTGVDARALQDEPLEALVARAGFAVAREAIRMLGGAYGRRIIVVAGPGNNGADGKVAARVLAARGARVEVVGPDVASVGACDLVIDAAFGTGFRGEYVAPERPEGSRVLAVDVPSGVQGDSGIASGRPWRAERTVTFVAPVPGLLQGDGKELAGTVVVADISLPAEPVDPDRRIDLVEDGDLARWLTPRGVRAHKWERALCLVAGSPGMAGAAHLAAAGAMRAGAGMVRLGMPGTDPATGAGLTEAVQFSLESTNWWPPALEAASRCHAMVVGPGLGRDETTPEEVRRVVAAAPGPLVLDADGLFALGRITTRLREGTGGQGPGAGPVVLTPHDGEYDRLAGCPPGPDRVAAARYLATISGAVALVKGSTTAVADPSGRVLLVTSGSSALATAGTGDVLSGVIGAFLAAGIPALEAAALAAHVHGRAGRLASGVLVAGDLPALVGEVVASLRNSGPESTPRGEHGHDGT